MWEKARAPDPKFETYQNRAKSDENIDKQIHECKQFNVFAEVTHKIIYLDIVRIIAWILGCYLCFRLRGKFEHTME